VTSIRRWRSGDDPATLVEIDRALDEQAVMIRDLR
jgi:hypothetical protein